MKFKNAYVTLIFAFSAAALSFSGEVFAVENTGAKGTNITKFDEARAQEKIKQKISTLGAAQKITLGLLWPNMMTYTPMGENDLWDKGCLYVESNPDKIRKAANIFANAKITAVRELNYPIYPIAGVIFKFADGRETKFLFNQDAPDGSEIEVEGRLDDQKIRTYPRMVKDLYRWAASTNIKTNCDQLTNPSKLHPQP
jgi:hypothetical protein